MKNIKISIARKYIDEFFFKSAILSEALIIIKLYDIWHSLEILINDKFILFFTQI